MSVITNLSEIVYQFRAELIHDLQLTESLVCPRCCITYVDGNLEDACRYEPLDDSASVDSDEPITQEVLNTKYHLICVFDFYDTPITEVITAWREKLLTHCAEIGGDALRDKWVMKTRDLLR